MLDKRNGAHSFLSANRGESHDAEKSGTALNNEAANGGEGCGGERLVDRDPVVNQLRVKVRPSSTRKRKEGDE